MNNKFVVSVPIEEDCQAMLDLERITVAAQGRDQLYVVLAFAQRFTCKIPLFEWAMLGSNQRPLPCEGSAIVCWEFLELAKCLQMEAFGLRRFSQPFRKFTRVAARLLHTTRRMSWASSGRFQNQTTRSMLCGSRSVCKPDAPSISRIMAS